jgi:hypothetical protein
VDGQLQGLDMHNLQQVLIDMQKAIDSATGQILFNKWKG